MLIIGRLGKYTNYSVILMFLRDFLYNNLNKVGKTNNSSGMATINPPITAIARGWCIFTPVPIPRASGKSAIMAPMAVIKFGRILKEMA